MSVPKAQIQKAVTALLKFMESISKSQPTSLTDAPHAIYLSGTLSYVPEKEYLKPRLIPVPYSPYPSDVRVCLFAKDEEKATLKESIQNIPGLTKVMSMKKLRTHFRTFKEKRELLNAYEIFLCDDRVVPALPRIVGKKFFDAKKQPIPIRIAARTEESENSEEDDTEKAKAEKADGAMEDTAPAAGKNDTTAAMVERVRRQVDRILHSAIFRIPQGPSITLRIGHMAQPPAELVANAAAVSSALLENPDPRLAPKDPAIATAQPAGCIEGLFLKGSTTPALPIYAALPVPLPDGAVPDKKPHKGASKKAKSAVGDKHAREEGNAGAPTRSDEGTRSKRWRASPDAKEEAEAETPIKPFATDGKQPAGEQRKGSPAEQTTSEKVPKRTKGAAHQDAASRETQEDEDDGEFVPAALDDEGGDDDDEGDDDLEKELDEEEEAALIAEGAAPIIAPAPASPAVGRKAAKKKAAKVNGEVVAAPVTPATSAAAKKTDKKTKAVTQTPERTIGVGKKRAKRDLSRDEDTPASEELSDDETPTKQQQTSAQSPALGKQKARPKVKKANKAKGVSQAATTEPQELAKPTSSSRQPKAAKPASKKKNEASPAQKKEQAPTPPPKRAKKSPKAPKQN